MDTNTLIAYLTEGLAPEQAAIVRSAVERDAVKSKVSALKQESEYNEIQTRAQQLQQELEGAPDAPGTRAYTAWYRENFPKIKAQAERLKAFEDKYGPIDPTTTTQGAPTQAQPMTPDQIQALVDRGFQEKYGNQISSVVITTGDILQRHLLAGRKSRVDFNALAKTAAEKYGGSLEQAYDEWDKPEREKEQKASTEAEISRRVNEEMQRRGTTQHFPTTVDNTPGALSSVAKPGADKFDRSSLLNELTAKFNSAGESASN